MADSRSGGEARLRIVPDAKAFPEDLKRDLAKVRAEFALQVTADTAQARADITRFREQEERRNVRMGVDMGLAQAQADMRAFKERNNSLAVKVDLEDGEAKAKMAALRAANRANNVRVKVDADTGGALSKITELDKTFSSILGTLGSGLKLNLSLVGIGELPAATLLITQAAGALQQLAQAGLALPGILGGAISSFGTFAIGIDGISEAYKAVTKAQDDAYKDGPKQAREMASANNAHRNAVVDEAQAERDRSRAVRDAKEQLEDLNLQLRGGQISEQQAVNNALRQRRDLQKDLATGQIKDQLDLQARLLDIQSADQSVAESRERNIQLQDKVAEANQKGITNSDAVVAANERVTRAQQAVASSAEAVNDAQQGSSGGQAAAQAMADLGSNAQEVVNALVGVRSQAKELRNDLSQKMLAGIAQGIKTLVSNDLPTFQRGLGGIATAWNGTLNQILSSLGSDRSKGLLDQLFGNTEEAQNRLTQAIQPGIDAILQLVATGSNALPRLADDVGKVADRFDHFISAAAGDGRLDKWINDGITGFEKVGNTLLNVGKAFGAITQAAGGGDGFLTMLQQGSEKLANFLNSVEGQNQLRQWFQEGRDEIQKLIPLLQGLPGFFKGVIDAGTEIANIVVPPLKDISKFLGEHPKLIQDVVLAFVAWKSIAGVASLISDLQKINGLLGKGGTKGGKGAGKGGAGILGKLGLLVGGGVLLNDVLDDDKPDDASPATPNAAPAPGALNPGDLPAGTPVPFGTVPIVPPGAAKDLARGAGTGAALSGGNPLGAGLGAFGAIPGVGPDNRSEDEKSVDTLIDALPRMSDEDVKRIFGDPAQLTVSQVKKMSRNDLRKRMLDAIAGKPLAPVAGLPNVSGNRGVNDGIDNPLEGQKHPTVNGGFATGGVLPGYSPGKDNMMVPLAGGEGIIRPEVVKNLGPGFIHALNQGGVPGYAPGGAVDPTAPNAPNPMNAPGGGGGINAIASSIAGGLGNVANNVTSLAQAVPGLAQQGMPAATTELGASTGLGDVHGFSNGAAPGPAQGGGGILGGLLGGLGVGGGNTGAVMPGLAGLFQAGSNPQALGQWAGQTGNWLGNWAGNFASQFLSTAYTGVLGFFGLDNSILSPSNPWFQDATKSLGIFNNLGATSGLGDTSSIGSQSITLGDGSTIDVPTFGTSTPLTPAGQQAVMGPDGKPLSASAVNAIQYAQGHAMGQKYVYGGVGAANAQGVPGYDCSGIASAVYAAATGRSQGTRYFTTESDFTKLGFQAGYQPGALNIGIMRGGGGPNSHMALTLPNGVNVESGGASDSTQYGGTAAGAMSKQFTLHYFLPLSGNAGQGAVPGLYAYGGDVSGGVQGRDSVPAMLMPGEHVLTTKDVAAMGGQGGVYRFRNALHMAEGGPIPLAAIPAPPPKPNFQQAPIQEIKPQAPTARPSAPAPRASAQIPSAPTTPLPSTVQPQAAPPPSQKTPVQPWQVGGPTPQGQAPSSLDHNLPAIDKGIDSAAQAIGQAASTAIGLAAGAAGSSGFAPGAGALGAIGPYVAGLIQEGGKVVKDVVNVGSSFLVGSVPGSFGTTQDSYGEMQWSQQNVPQTANDNRATYNIQAGYKPMEIMDAIALREAQHSQAALATVRG